MNFISGLIVAGSGGHHIEEFGEFDLSTAVLIELSNHLIDCLGFGFDTEGIDCDFEFLMKKGVPLGSMAPPRSLSKRSNAFLISRTSS